MDFAAKYDRRPSPPLDIGPDDIAAIAERILPSPLRTATPLSGGFSSHNLLLAFEDGERCVLRLSSDTAKIQKEADLLTFAAANAANVPVPKVIWRGDDTARPALAMEYVEGDLLAVTEDSFDERQATLMCRALGRVAAAIHGISFDRAGILGPGPKVTEPFGSYRAGAAEFFASSLDDPNLRRRVGPDRLERLVSCLSLPDEITGSSNDRQLCHSDFNQKNIMVRIGRSGDVEIAAILDWEFAMSGSGIVDLGNLLRFEDESRAVASDCLARAYREAGGHLDGSWRQQSLFADLLAQLEHLTGDAERPRTFATSLAVIDRALPALGA